MNKKDLIVLFLEGLVVCHKLSSFGDHGDIFFYNFNTLRHL